jgi:hypothetical protein
LLLSTVLGCAKNRPPRILAEAYLTNEYSSRGEGEVCVEKVEITPEHWEKSHYDVSVWRIWDSSQLANYLRDELERAGLDAKINEVGCSKSSPKLSCVIARRSFTPDNGPFPRRLLTYWFVGMQWNVHTRFQCKLKRPELTLFDRPYDSSTVSGSPWYGGGIEEVSAILWASKLAFKEIAFSLVNDVIEVMEKGAVDEPDL